MINELYLRHFIKESFKIERIDLNAEDLSNQMQYAEWFLLQEEHHTPTCPIPALQGAA